jgi:hypothetical protein
MSVDCVAEKRPECRVVQCNYRNHTSACASGSRAYLTHSIDSARKRVRVVARSRSGRWIVRWERLGLLCNFRFKTLVPEHLIRRTKSPVALDYWNQEVVDNLNRLASEPDNIR